MGNIPDDPGAALRARMYKIERKAKRKERKHKRRNPPRAKSVNAVSGGLPSLGKRRP